MSIDALQSGMRSGVIDSVLFPPNPVARAPQVISDLRAVFPLKVGTLTFGPALKVGWGQGIILVSLGIVIQLDNVLGPGAGNVSIARIVLLGQFQLKLPPGADTPAIVKLLVDILGYYDFEEKELGIDARLRDSSLAGLPLTGSICVRARFGQDPTFLLAAGGFHPRFTDLPAGIPQQDRLGVNLVYGPLVIQIGTYVAITSNSFQFGAEARLQVEQSDFKVEAYLAFDVLIIFVPKLSFTFEFRVGAAITWKGHDLASIRVKGVVTGPGRWEFEGTASFKVLFWDVEVGFHEAWGDAPALALVDDTVLDKILAELSDVASWSASLPGGRQLATLRQLGEETTVVAHPLGMLEGRQKVVPFGLTIERVRGVRPTDGNRFDLGAVQIGGTNVTATRSQEHFARGEYFNLSEDAKLTTPSFERFDAGIRIGTDQFSAGPAVAFDPEYETAYLEQPDVTETVRLDGAFLLGHVKYSATARSKANLAGRLAGRERMDIGVAEPEYVLASGDTLLLLDTPGNMATNFSIASAKSGEHEGALVVDSAELIAT